MAGTKVSILVLVDVALEQWPECRSQLSECEVSILVLVDVALEPYHSCRNLSECQVSILVLVDVALERFARQIEGAVEWRFNPCSRGCRS